MRTRDDNNRALWLFIVGFFFQTLPGAMLAPMLSLSMAARGAAPALIGALATAPALAYMLALTIAPALIRRLGERGTLRAATVAGGAATLGILLVEAPALWAALFAVVGFAAGLRYTIAEAWVPAFGGAEGRGRALAIFQTAVGAALFAGSGALLLTGVDGAAPRAAVALAVLAGAAMIWLAPSPGESEPVAAGARPMGARAAMAGAGPLVLSAALLGGLFESGMSVALPLFGLASGLSPALATGLVTAIGLGSLAQYPFGYLADRFPWRRVTLGTAGLIGASALLLPLAAAWPWLMALLGALWGSAGGGLYTLAAIHNGARHRGAQLVAASVATQFAYMVGEAAGPTLGGLALNMAPEHGLPALVAGAGLLGLGGMLLAARRGDAPRPARPASAAPQPEAA